MGIGPVLDCPKELTARFAAVLQPEGIAVTDSPCGVQFRRNIARIDGKKHLFNDRCLVWLTFPRAHAFNPLLWWFDLALCKRIHLALRRHGAAESDFTTFMDAVN